MTSQSCARWRVPLAPRPPSLSVFLWLLSGDSPCWKHAEEDTHREGEEKGKAKNEWAEMDLRGARQRSGGKLEGGAGSPCGEREAECAPGQSKERAFGEQLPDDARAAGAEGETNGEFLSASVRASQHEVGDVDAGDEKGRSRLPLKATRRIAERSRRSPRAEA